MTQQKRKPHFPPDPGHYNRPWTDVPRFIHGEYAIAGYGDRWFYVATIPSPLARRTIIENHYSGNVVNNSYVHLGVFIDGTMIGVLQFGYALNPATMSKIVAETGSTDYLELNRMWLSDAAPHNSESRAISYAFKYIRQTMPQVQWVQSFADERCGGWGVVYQAANFEYLGSHVTVFYELDGVTYHEMLLTAHKKGGGRGVHLREHFSRAIRREFYQFRYIYFLHRKARRRLKYEPQPYPKRDQPETKLTPLKRRR